jgi:hypothetical protein
LNLNGYYRDETVVRENPKRRITITLAEDIFNNVSSIAAENDLSIARVIRYAVDNLLKERKEGHHQQLLLRFGIKEERHLKERKIDD